MRAAARHAHVLPDHVSQDDTIAPTATEASGADTLMLSAIGNRSRVPCCCVSAAVATAVGADSFMNTFSKKAGELKDKAMGRESSKAPKEVTL